VKVRAVFRCPSCGRDTEHELHYADRVLHEIRCLECSRQTYSHHRVLWEYLKELPSRLATKPVRLWRELRGKPGLLRTLPKRIASKPVRIVREMKESRR
jgi:DNA-directed RNA polymerase subunit RPC12/RpoP